MKKIILFIIAALILTSAGPAMADITTNVSGKACPYFAGQTSGLIPLAGVGLYFNTDAVDASTLPPWIDITGFGGPISITASGLWDHTPSYLTVGSGPEGKANYFTTDADYDDLGISLMQDAPVNMLLGVFLTNAAPSGAAPTGLTYGDSMTRPLLQQTFAIGATLENIIVPTGAPRLFFGLNNGWEWTNNSGSVDVTVVPIPGAVLLGMLGLSVAGVKLRKHA